MCWRGQDLCPNPQIQYSTVCLTSLFGSLIDNSNSTCRFSLYLIHLSQPTLVCHFPISGDERSFLPFAKSRNLSYSTPLGILFGFGKDFWALIIHCIDFQSDTYHTLSSLHLFLCLLCIPAHLYCQLLEARDPFIVCPRHLAQCSIK